MAPIFSQTRKPDAQGLRSTSASASGPNAPPATPRAGASSKKRPLGGDAVASSPAQPSATKRARATHLEAAAPLAERLRPQSLDQFVGQPHLTGEGSLLMSLLERGSAGSMILWGPPGCGKTTLARLLAKRADAVFKELSATVVGINDVRNVFDEAKGTLQLTGRKTILFLDEIHRFTKSQQDIFLPYIEQGHIQLIGATTENPSFKVNGALLSRCRVFVLERLTDADIRRIITHAIERISPSNTSHVAPGRPNTPPPSSPFCPSSPGSSQVPASQTTAPSSSHPETETETAPFPAYPQLTARILASLVSLSTGDARTALSLLELILSASPSVPEQTLLESLRRSVSASYDRTGDSHYDMISALHKSVRTSDVDAALYWLARMLSAGEDPLYIARRAIVIASEDIGLADSHALPLATATLTACQFVGMPECRINLAHLIAYLAEAPKSIRSWEAYGRAEAAAKRDMTLPVPMTVRNAPTKLMKELGYSEGYRYNPDYAHPVHNDCLPSELRGQKFMRAPGDMDGKIWDEEALKRWESENGKRWEGREERG